MKFQKLTIHNIASIEDAVIDFEAPPLADSEVFLITGKTGAGKSTILDAICLALYADTPRLYSTKMQGVTIDAKKEIKIDDPRQLMRRNTTEAYTTLTFLGSNGISYEATWAAARSYKKINGPVKSKTWELKNLNTNATLTKDAEIKNEIRAAVGLDFSQFCRTTMLAQGEFTRFLNSKDDEKAEILEKITGVDIYSKIGAKVFELTSQKKQEWEDAKRVAEGTSTFSDKEIEERNKLISELDAKQKELKAASSKDCAKRDWIKAEAKLAQDVSVATENLHRATEYIESENFKEKESLIKDWNATIDARIWMTEADKASAVQTQQRNILGNMASDYAAILGGQKYAEAESITISDEFDAVNKFLNREKEKSAVYEQAQTIVSLLTIISKGRDTIAKSNAEIENEYRLLNENLIPALLRAQSEAKEAKDIFDHEEAEMKILEEEAAALNLQDLHSRHGAAKELMGNIKRAKEHIEILDSIKLRRETMRQNLTELHAAIDEKKNKSAAADASVREAKLKRDIHKEVLDKQSDTINTFASVMRQKLQIGDTCPVCLQKIAAQLPHEEELHALISDLQKAYDDAENEYRVLAETKNKLDTEIRTETAAFERDAKTFHADTSVVDAETKTMEACKECGISILDDTTLPALEALESSTKTLIDELGTKIKNGEAKETASKKQRKKLEEERNKIEALVKKTLKAEKSVNDCKGRIHTTDTLAKTKRHDVDAAEQNVRKLVTGGSWDIDWYESPNEFGKALTAAAQTYSMKIQEKLSLASRLNTAKANIQNVASVIEAILVSMPTWKEIKASNASKIDNLLDKANSIDNKVAVALNRQKTAEDSYNINKAKLDAFLAEKESLSAERLTSLCSYTHDDITSEDGKLMKYRHAVVAQKTLLDNATKLLHEHQQKKPELDEEETLERLLERIAGYETQMEEIGEQRGSINQELRTDAENKLKLEVFIIKADEKKAAYQKWTRLNQLIGNSSGSTFRKIAQSYVLASLIHSANNYMKTLTDRYTLKVNPGTFVISLEDAYQGFVSRAASTISGGESFLVSLSLALALSDIGQQWQVDTLFIDEGFGTLSGEPLQKAIETLRSLHSKAGRHVGIISHVEELQERIHVQIQVNQEGHNSSSKVRIVSGEAAKMKPS